MRVSRGRNRGQSGYTIVEVVLAILVASTAVIAIAAGLLSSMSIDRRTNTRQRTNLALSTFVENLDFVAISCPSMPLSGAAPTSVGENDASHATTLLENALAKPQVEQWTSRGMIYTVTGVEYADWEVAETDPEVFDGSCDDDGPADDAPYYPVIRVTVEVCEGIGGASATSCEDGQPVESAAVIKRGGRSGA